MLQLNRIIGTTVLLCVVAGCRGADTQPPAAERPAASVQEAPAPPQQAAPPPSAPIRRATAATEPVPAGPAPEVVVNGVRTNGDAAVMADFQKRVATYLAVKKGVDKKTPDQKETKDPVKIEATQKLLASKIISARTGARQGDIFTPEVRTKFRQLLIPEVKGTTGKETKQEIDEEFEEHEAENRKGPLKVNAEYPQGMPLATTPPNVLLSLPKLPDGLEYRFVEKTLLIRDADANVIVDLMPNAIR
jgi:hypothetical protein